MDMKFTEQDWKRYTAELIGAFFLTFGGMSAILGTRGDLVPVAIAHGGILGIMIYQLGGVSGGHFNPAVSFSLFIQRKLGSRDFLMYFLFQVIGATIGAMIAANLFPTVIVGTTAALDGATLGALTKFPTSNFYSPGAALLLEILMTFALATSVAIVVAGGEKMARLSGALIGGTLAICIMFGGPWTGGSLNPARSLGPAFASGTNSVVWGSIWLYVVGPLLGGALAALAFMWFKGDLKIHLVTSQPPSPPPAWGPAPQPAPTTAPPAPAPSDMPLPAPSNMPLPQPTMPPSPPNP